jgi:hypothetical protein
MNWFQQNRWLGSFLVVFGICVLIAGLLFFLARSNWSSARSEFDRAAAERSRLEGLDPFPNDANYRKMKLLLENYGAALDKLKEELKTQALPAPPLAPNEFQSRLLQTMLATTQKARTNKVKLPAIFYLGFDRFVTSLPNSNETATLLGQELSQIQMLINILLDARVDSVTSLQRTPLPEERGVPPAPSPAPSRGRKPVNAVVAGPKMLERNVVDLSFKASPSAARKVLNQIASAPAQFYIVRTLYVRNEKDTGPPRGKTAETKPPANSPSAPSQPANAPLNFIVGNEHIDISAQVEMLRFTFDAK